MTHLRSLNTPISQGRVRISTAYVSIVCFSRISVLSDYRHSVWYVEIQDAYTVIMRLIRNAAWQLMTPTLGGTINSSFFEEYDTTVQAALSSNSDVYVIVDLVSELECWHRCALTSMDYKHNYARWNGDIVGQGGPTNAQFASIWTQLADEYGSNDRIILYVCRGSLLLPEILICVCSGIMNEPHDLNVTEWVASVQYVVNAVRSAGSTNYLLLPGSTYSSAQTFPTEAGPYLVDVTDPLGGTDKLLFDGE